HIVEGMYAFLCGNRIEDAEFSSPTSAHTVDPSLFTADSVMEFGYCTELLLRLQTAKTDPAAFDVGILTEYLQSIGDSVVTVKSDSIVKLHVHTMTPYKVLEFCQRFGEFLTVKIENMMLQHNETLEKEAHTVPAAKTNTKRRPFAVVAVAMGEGIRNSFSEMGADAVIEGGQTMNPSAEDFLNAFDEVNADTVFVLPNNGNILLAARQAAQMYAGSDVRVIPTHSIGDGYAVLSMLDPDSGNADRIEAEMNDAMQGVLTAEISQSIRNADLNGVSVHCGEYIGFIGKEIIASCPNREEAACRTLERMDLSSHGLVLVIRGKQTAQTDAKIVSDYIRKHYPTVEICESDGGQDVYDYILVAE
ncbi:MAG: hypothetical protein IJW92_08695, partial [Clostridia bacterium]|nr:hypothetical protein [Clostridia bacterium]